jgi:hypothetical protein
VYEGSPVVVTSVKLTSCDMLLLKLQPFITVTKRYSPVKIKPWDSKSDEVFTAYCGSNIFIVQQKSLLACTAVNTCRIYFYRHFRHKILTSI